MKSQLEVLDRDAYRACGSWLGSRSCRKVREESPGSIGQSAR